MPIVIMSVLLRGYKLLQFIFWHYAYCFVSGMCDLEKNFADATTYVNFYYYLSNCVSTFDSLNLVTTNLLLIFLQ